MKKIIFTFSLLLSIIYIQAQDIKSIIATVPDHIIFGLEASQKDLLLANPGIDTVVVISTGLYEGMKRTSLTDDYLCIETSKTNSVQIKLLPLINDSKIICVAYTASGQFSDSKTEFYTTNWQQINTPDLFPAKNYEWFIKPGTDKSSNAYKNAIAALDMNPMKIILSGDKDEAFVYSEIEKYLSENDYKMLKPFLIDENHKTLEWDKIRFNLR